MAEPGKICSARPYSHAFSAWQLCAHCMAWMENMSRIIEALKSALRWSRGDKSAGKSTIIRVPAKPGTRERAVLHAIRVLHDNAYGVTIQEELERVKIDLSFGAINDCLGWLEGNGFVEWKMGEAPSIGGGRRAWKKLYSLTEKGTGVLRG